MLFKETYGPWAIIAGGSEGIGAAYATQLAKRGVHLILIGRSQAKLERFKQSLQAEANINIRLLSLDLGEANLKSKLEEHTSGFDIGLIIYNAAVSQATPFTQQSLEDKLNHIDVNCRGLLIFTHTFANKLVARGRGGIIIMSSLSGFQGSGLATTYAATKAFNTILGEGLWEELRHKGVDCIVCAPGATRTPKFDDETLSHQRVKLLPITPEKVALAALDNLGKGPVKIPGKVNRCVYFVLSLFSRKQVIKFISLNSRKSQKTQSQNAISGSL